MSVQFDLDGPVVAPRDAATVIVLRDRPEGVEIFFVKRHAHIRFMGGAYVFPGGKLDAADCDEQVPCDLDAAAAGERLADSDVMRARGLHVAAARECLEEAGILFARETVSAARVQALRTECAKNQRAFGDVLRSESLVLRLSALVPWCRWITPRAESRRFDARFFLAAAPDGVVASHDDGETVASQWLTPREALARAARQEIVIVPPTYRCLELLAQARDVRHALAMAPRTIPTLEPAVLPGPGGELIVVLPGDIDHPDGAPRMTASSTADERQLATRFTYDDGAWSVGSRPKLEGT